MDRSNPRVESRCDRVHQHYPGGTSCDCSDAPHYHDWHYCKRSWLQPPADKVELPIGSTTYEFEFFPPVLDKWLLSKFVSMLHGGPVIKLADLGIDPAVVFALVNYCADKPYDLADAQYQKDRHLFVDANRLCEDLIKKLHSIDKLLPPTPVMYLRPSNGLPFETIWPADKRIREELERKVGAPLRDLIELSTRPKGRPSNYRKTLFITGAADLSWNAAQSFHDEHWVVLFNLVFNKRLSIDSYGHIRRRIRRSPAEQGTSRIKKN
jgi:hypothetical protein